MQLYFWEEFHAEAATHPELETSPGSERDRTVVEEEEVRFMIFFGDEAKST